MNNANTKLGLSRIAAGECYHATAKLVYEHQQELAEHQLLAALPAALLVGFALELYLKGYLILLGQPPEIVRAHGHLLDVLTAEARKVGLTGVIDLERLASSLGGGFNRDFTYRYPDPGHMIRLPNWPRVEPILNGLLCEIAPVVQALEAEG